MTGPTFVPRAALVCIVCSIAAAAPVTLAAQAAPSVFKQTATLGTPVLIGDTYTVLGTKEVLDVGAERLVTVNATRLAAVYPNRAKTIIANAGEKLLIVQGSLKNPSKTGLPVSGASAPFRLRFYDADGTSRFTFVSTFDATTGDWVSGTLAKGDSTNFECVFRMPAAFRGFRVGLYYENRARMAGYDFNPTMQKITSVFSRDGIVLDDRATVADGRPFDFDVFMMSHVRFTSSGSGSDRKGVVSVDVRNAVLLPEKWGWQYVTPELVLQDGSVVTGKRDLIDQATGRTWSGDLGPNATMTAGFVFTLAPGAVPTTFRLTSLLTKRTVDVTL